MSIPQNSADSATRIILDSISDGVFTVDHDFEILTFNRAASEITGFSKDEAIGRHCWEVFRSDMCESGCNIKKTLSEGKTITNRSTIIVSRFGRKIPISVSTSLLKDYSGNILGAVETFRDKTVVEELRRELHGNKEMGGMVSISREMRQIFAILKQVAESDSTILIEGETGTGKEVLSRAIHTHSYRHKDKFVAINCGALPDSLLESELFGYKAGAFTGAVRDKQGLFASAGSGTILLDEIGDTSPAFQIKLLRLLEEKEYQPLGSVTTFKTDARIIAATHKNLVQMLDEESFRQDLFYRINVVHLKLPPLRRRTEDIPLLIETFIKKMNVLKGANVTGISSRPLKMLLSHDYPGNIRELENIIEHCFVLNKEGFIEVEHLPSYLLSSGDDNVAKIPYDNNEPDTLRTTVHLTETQVILQALKENGYNRKLTAKKLGMNKSTLYRKMKKLKIELPKVDGRSVICSIPENR